jgi:hypothetical protein
MNCLVDIDGLLICMPHMVLNKGNGFMDSPNT